MSESQFVEVILPLALPKLYTYSVPSSLQKQLCVGARVVVQFGKKKLYSAIVYSIHSNAPSAYKTKDIVQLIDDEPLVSAVQLKFWEWMASYYMCTLGEVMKAALPSGLKMESETQLLQGAEYAVIELFNESEREVMAAVETSSSPLSIQQLISKVQVNNPIGVIKGLLDRQALAIHENIQSAFKPKYETFVRLHSRLKTDDDVNQLFEELSRADAQQKWLMAFLALTATEKKTFTDWVPKKLLAEKSNASPAAFNALIKKEIFEVESREVSRLLNEDSNEEVALTLSDAQLEAVNKLHDDFREKNVVLLHGVTSSGKTEIYISLIQEQFAQGKQVLYLLPEIALTAQIINRLKRFFGKRVGIYHSKFSDNQRVEVYKSLLSEGIGNSGPKYDIILGVRSSIFLPFKRLGLIIVDEEHENTFKQFSPSPRYNARDSAILLAGMHGAKVLLGTATPSVETYYNAQTGKFGFAQLTKRYSDISLPKIEVVDTLLARKRKKIKSLFSDKLLDAIGRVLAEGNQVILFQNRRGYSPFVECDECAWVPQCEHCAVSLTLHKQSNQLVCHYCGYAIQNLTSCLACGSHRLSTKGFGTEKVEDELAIFFPAARIARMDMDTTRSRNSYERIITSFEQGNVDILVGTQMVTKGLDFDRVKLVGILNADNMLNFPDFRAFERSFQLMAQVSGRAGRKGEPGEVIIQTANPNHPVIKQVVSNDFDGHFKSQLAERKQYNYPPYYRLIKLSLKHRNASVLDVASVQLGRNLRAVFKSRVLGPEEPIVSRVQNYYIKDILIKLERNANLPKAKEIIADQVRVLMEYSPYRGLMVLPDVDPM